MRSGHARHLVFALCAICASEAIAQPKLEEVIVTATRRESNLQKTGISVTALSSQMLKQFDITSTDQMTIATPGLMFQNGGGAPLTGLVSIRGVSQNDFAGHIESPNATYLDSVYEPSTSVNSMALFDIERVEILRGPQGTLFGRNATGGLINIITRKPNDTFGGYIKAHVGSYHSYGVKGAISGPITDTIKARLALLYNKADGYIKNSLGPDENDDNTKAVRLHLAFDPTDNLHILLSPSYYKQDMNAAGGAYSQAAAVDPVTGLGYNVGNTSNLITGYVDADGDRYSGAFDEPGYLLREWSNVTAKITYNFNDLSLISLSNYNGVHVNYLEDNDLSPFPFTVFGQTSDAENFSQELRLENAQGKLRWTAGLYFLSIDGNYTQSLRVLPPPAYDASVLDLGQKAIYSVDTTSYSAFGQFEYDLTSSLTLTAGLRWTYDAKDYKYNIQPRLISGGVPIPGVLPLGAPPGSLAAVAAANDGIGDHNNENGRSTRLQLDYTPTDQWLLYASFNEGYKSFNYNAGFAGLAPYSRLRFDGEKIYAYEVGSKLQFWGGRARWNISAYYYDYKDYQAFDQRGINFTLYNTDATINGMDTEFVVRPLEHTTIRMNAAYLDTKVENVPIGTDPANPIYVNREAPQSPKWTFSAAISQEFVIKQGMISAHLTAYYNDGYYAQLSNAPNTKIPDYTIYNGRISFTTTDKRYEIAVFGRNLTDKDYMTYAFDIAANGFTEQTLGMPRWWGVDFRYTFGSP